MNDRGENSDAHKGAFQGKDGWELFGRSWEVEGDERGAVVILHGFGEHCGRYGHVAERLNGAGYSVHTYDQRGHGKAQGQLGYINSFGDFIDDLGVYMELLRPKVEGKNLFLFGHSMGTLVLGNYVVQHHPKVQGLIFSGSGLRLGEDVSPLLRGLSGFLGTFFPKLTVVAKVDSSTLSHSAEVSQAYDDDPLVYHGGIMARTGRELMKGAATLREGMGAIRDPVLILHGAEDELAPAGGSQDLFDGVSSEDKTLKVYEGARHEVFNDTAKELFLGEVVGWIQSHSD